jgi:hypothetical protein
MKHSSKILAHTSAVLAVLTLLSCSTTSRVTVKTDYEHGVSFGKYHTYAIDPAPTGLGPSTQAVLQSTLRTSLAARGFKETSPGNASLYIVSTVYTRQKVDVMPTGGVTLYRSSNGQYRPGNVALNADVQQYTEGSLVIDFVDTKTHQLVFRGLAQAVASTAQRNAAAVQDAVNRIVAAYPGPGA